MVTDKYTLGGRSTNGNSTFAIGGISFSADCFSVAESLVLRKNICAEKPAHRKSAKRYAKAYEPTTQKQTEK